MDSGNRLVAAWREAQMIGPLAWCELDHVLDLVRVRDVTETVKWLNEASRDGVDAEVVGLATFCYEACEGPLRNRVAVTAQAARALQRAFVACQGRVDDPYVVEAVLRAAAHAPLRALSDQYRVLARGLRDPLLPAEM